MAISESDLLIKFARELRDVVESFEEEAEILADRELLREIEESEREYQNGEVMEFTSIENLREELGRWDTD